MRWFSTFTQRSLGDAEEVEIAPAAELAAEYRELAEIAVMEAGSGGERPDVAELLPVDRFGSLLDLVSENTAVVVATEEEIAPALSDQWDDDCAAFHDADAHDLYVKPQDVSAALTDRTRVWLSAISGDQPLESGKRLSILIEKDFQCLHGDVARDPDAYPNPLEETVS